VGARASGAMMAVGMVAALPAWAQDVPVPATPPPSTDTTLPGVLPERFSLAPPRPTPTPSASPSPTPAPSPAAALPVPERRVQQPVRSPVPVPVQSSPAPVPLPSQVPSVSPAPTPTAPESQVAATPVAPATPLPAAPPAEELPAWLWALAGAAGAGLAFGAYRLLLRRRTADEALADDEPVTVAPPLPVRDPVRRPSAPPGLARPPAPSTAVPLVAQTNAEPFEILVRPARLDFTAEELVLEVELLIGNRQVEAAENIRVQLALISASPDQDRHSAGFHAATMLGDSAVPAFDLGSGAGGRLPVRLALRRDALHVVQAAGRPMVVPMMLIDLRWRAGISIRRFGADFMVGTAGQGQKLGPIWLDRPSVGALSATRYLPRAVAVA